MAVGEVGKRLEAFVKRKQPRVPQREALFVCLPLKAYDDGKLLDTLGFDAFRWAAALAGFLPALFLEEPAVKLSGGAVLVVHARLSGRNASTAVGEAEAGQIDDRGAGRNEGGEVKEVAGIGREDGVAPAGRAYDNRGINDGRHLGATAKFTGEPSQVFIERLDECPTECHCQSGVAGAAPGLCEHRRRHR
jgi:hypothetical protein